MKNLQKIIVLILLVGLFAFVNEAAAQCPMCKTAVESNQKAGGTKGAGLNDGILYLLAMPYVLVGGVAFFWYRSYRRKASVK